MRPVELLDVDWTCMHGCVNTFLMIIKWTIFVAPILMFPNYSCSLIVSVVTAAGRTFNLILYCLLSPPFLSSLNEVGLAAQVNLCMAPSTQRKTHVLL